MRAAAMYRKDTELLSVLGRCESGWPFIGQTGTTTWPQAAIKPPLPPHEILTLCPAQSHVWFQWAACHLCSSPGWQVHQAAKFTSFMQLLPQVPAPFAFGDLRWNNGHGGSRPLLECFRAVVDGFHQNPRLWSPLALEEPTIGCALFSPHSPPPSSSP